MEGKKQNHGYTRTRRRGINNVSAEAMLELIGLNIYKLFKFYETNSYPKFWVAPCDLKPQTFKKPSAKRFSKKGSKINAKIYKNKQAKLVYKPNNFLFFKHIKKEDGNLFYV